MGPPGFSKGPINHLWGGLAGDWIGKMVMKVVVWALKGRVRLENKKESGCNEEVMANENWFDAGDEDVTIQWENSDGGREC